MSLCFSFFTDYLVFFSLETIKSRAVITDDRTTTRPQYLWGIIKIKNDLN